MKINNSVVQFKLTCIRKRDGSYYTMDEIPYWSLYSQSGDSTQWATGEQWRSPVAMTYNEVVNFLSDCPNRHVLAAYPRFSRTTRRSYIYGYSAYSDEFTIIDRYTGELLYSCTVDDGTCTYLDEQYSDSRRFYDKFFNKYGLERHTSLAKRCLESVETDN